MLLLVQCKTSTHRIIMQVNETHHIVVNISDTMSQVELNIESFNVILKRTIPRMKQYLMT
jgi:hypothetical protein